MQFFENLRAIQKRRECIRRILEIHAAQDCILIRVEKLLAEFEYLQKQVEGLSETAVQETQNIQQRA